MVTSVFEPIFTLCRVPLSGRNSPKSFVRRTDSSRHAVGTSTSSGWTTGSFKIIDFDFHAVTAGHALGR